MTITNTVKWALMSSVFAASVAFAAKPPPPPPIMSSICEGNRTQIKFTLINKSHQKLIIDAPRTNPYSTKCVDAANQYCASWNYETLPAGTVNPSFTTKIGNFRFQTFPTEKNTMSISYGYFISGEKMSSCTVNLSIQCIKAGSTGTGPNPGTDAYKAYIPPLTVVANNTSGSSIACGSAQVTQQPTWDSDSMSDAKVTFTINAGDE